MKMTMDFIDPDSDTMKQKIGKLNMCSLVINFCQTYLQLLIKKLIARFNYTLLKLCAIRQILYQCLQLLMANRFCHFKKIIAQIFQLKQK